MPEQFNLWSGKAEEIDLDAHDLVYGPSRYDGGLVFIQRRVATDRAKVWGALSSSKTWGEFKASVGDRIYQSILDRGQFEGCYSFARFYHELKQRHPTQSKDDAAETNRGLPVGDTPIRR